MIFANLRTLSDHCLSLKKEYVFNRPMLFYLFSKEWGQVRNQLHQSPHGKFSHESGIKIVARAGQIPDNMQVLPRSLLLGTLVSSWRLLFAALLVLQLCIELEAYSKSLFYNDI